MRGVKSCGRLAHFGMLAHFAIDGCICLRLCMMHWGFLRDCREGCFRDAFFLDSAVSAENTGCYVGMRSKTHETDGQPADVSAEP